MSAFKPIGRKRKFIRQENPQKLFKLMTKNHLDVLQNIESSLISAYRRSADIDDKVVVSALKTAIAGSDASNDSSRTLVKDLENTRLLRADVSDEIWSNGLKVVLQSVYNHSDAQTGDTDYLDFIADFVV